MKKETILLPENDAEYFRLDRMSNSALKHFKRSPRHYLWSKMHKETTPAMVFGSAFHCFVLEPERFKEDYAVKDKVDGRTKAGKEYNDWFEIENGDKEILDSESFVKIQRMNDVLMKNKFAVELLSEPGEVEKPFLWTDELTGIEMKGKMDKVCNSFTLDLKTTINATPESFASTCFNDYLTQPAVYRDARKHEGMKKGDFYFIAIEKEPPYGISIHKCGMDFFERGWDAYQTILADYAYWIEMGQPDADYVWQSPKGYFTLNLPFWAK
jgi:hypothetical protein